MRSKQLQPIWDRRFWDGQPVIVKLDKLRDFLEMNRMHVQRSRWPEGQIMPTFEVVRDEQCE